MLSGTDVSIEQYFPGSLGTAKLPVLGGTLELSGDGDEVVGRGRPKWPETAPDSQEPGESPSTFTVAQSLDWHVKTAITGLEPGSTPKSISDRHTDGTRMVQNPKCLAVTDAQERAGSPGVARGDCGIPERTLYFP